MRAMSTSAADDPPPMGISTSALTSAQPSVAARAIPDSEPSYVYFTIASMRDGSMPASRQAARADSSVMVSDGRPEPGGVMAVSPIPAMTASLGTTHPPA